MTSWPMNNMQPPPTQGGLLPRTSASIARIVEYHGPGAMSAHSVAANPPPRQSAGAKPFLLLPSQPQPDEVAAVTQHLMARPLNQVDVENIRRFEESLELTIGDYAPGGELGPGDPYGATQIR